MIGIFVINLKVLIQNLQIYGMYQPFYVQLNRKIYT